MRTNLALCAYNLAWAVAVVVARRASWDGGATWAVAVLAGGGILGLIITAVQWRRASRTRA